MDGRKLLAGVALAAALSSGCSHFGTQSPGSPKLFDPTKPPTLPPAQAPEPVAKKGDGRPKATTFVMFGDCQLGSAELESTAPTDRDRMREKARQSYQTAIEIDPKCVQAHLALARYYTVIGEREQSAQSFARAAALAPRDASLPFEQGMSLVRGKQLDAAAASFAKARELDPENKQYAKQHGLTLARLGKNEEAYTALRKGMNEADAHYTLARMLYHTQQPEAAQQHMVMALKANPQHAGALAALNPTRTTSEPAVRTVSYEEPARSATTNAPQPLMMGGGP